MTRRPGMSLTEVLVALFLMAIGVIGVLTMFPVGAVQMGQALKDQRCAEAATQADSYLRWYWRHEIIEKAGNNEPLWTALNAVNNVPQPNPPTNNQPSPAVVVDPMGMVARGTVTTGTVAGLKSLQRVNLDLLSKNPPVSPALAPTFALRACTLLDGFTFDQTGIPSGSTLERENRYNWLWVVQRPSNSQPFTANMTVVVFGQRAHMYVPPAAETAVSSTNFATGATGFTLVSSIPALQKGGWIMDASDASTVGGVQMGDFYRTVSVSVNGNVTSVEVQAPLATPVGGGARPATGTAVYLAGVSEVFARPVLTPDSPVIP